MRFPILAVGILAGSLAINRFGREAVEIAVGLYLLTLLLPPLPKKKNLNFQGSAANS